MGNASTAQYPAVKISGVKNNVGSAGEDAVTEVTRTAFVAKTPEVFTHDLDGNLITDGRWTYTWDAENRLTAVETNPAVASAYSALKQRLEFAYDAQGRRIQKVVKAWSGSQWSVVSDRRFLYDGWNLVAEFQVLNSALSLLHSYVWGLDLSGSMQGAGGVGSLLAVATYAGSSTPDSWLLTCYDGNGNLLGLIDAADGTLAAEYEYDPFGNTIKATGTAANAQPFGFSTKYTDTETNLCYYGFRYYNPSTGRWLSRDPLGEAGGLNVYGMVDNDPIGSVDPVGLEAMSGNTDISLDSLLPISGLNLPVTWKGRLFWKKVCCDKAHSTKQNAGQTRYIITIPSFEASGMGTVEATQVKTWVRNWVRKKVKKDFLRDLLDTLDGSVNVGWGASGKFSIHYDGCVESVRVAGSSNVNLSGNVSLSSHLGGKENYSELGANGSVAGSGVLALKAVNTRIEMLLRKNASVDLSLGGYYKLVVDKNPLIEQTLSDKFNIYTSDADVSLGSFDLLNYVK